MSILQKRNCFFATSILMLGILTFVPFSTPAFGQSAFEDPGAAVKGKAGGDLAPVEKKVDAGAITLGASSQVVILFQNNGGRPITTGAISLYPSSNVSASVAKNECAQEPLVSGTVCAIAMSVKGLQPGQFRIEMLMRHDGRTKLITSTITGSVESSDDKSRELINDIESIPQSLDFGTLNDSRPQVRSVILRNVTSKTVDITSMQIESNVQSGFSLETDCTKLETGAACVATVVWSPTQKGPATGVLVVRHSGPTGVASIDLDGIFTPSSASEAAIFPDAVPGKGLLTASQSSVDFGSGIETSSAITVSLVNVGDAPVSLRDIRLSNEDNGVRIARNGCAPGTLLDPVEACPLTLVWDPVREGSVLDDIQIIHNGARGILVLPLRGSATKAINKDSKAIMLSEPLTIESLTRNIPPLPSSAVEGYEAPEENYISDDQAPVVRKAKVRQAPREVNVSGVLDGFKISSLAKHRAIIAGPGGSRVVFSGEETVIGGVLWNVDVRQSGVQFTYGKQRVLLPFDRSLSSFDSGVIGSGTNSNSSSNNNEE